MTLTNNSDKEKVEKGPSNVVFGDSSSTYSTAGGRISKAGTTVKLQLLKLSFDQYHIHTSSNIALAILRDIKSTPVRIRRTVAYARRVRNLLTILNNYNRATYEAKGKYPYSKALVRLLVRYVQLEYDVLYYPENYSVKYEKEVEVKVHFLLHLLLDGVVRKFRQENVQHYDSTATECVLRIFNQVNGEYKVKGRFIWSAINKLAKKLGLLETISEIRQNGVLLSQNHPTFTKLSCDNIEDISDCDSEYEIPLSPARSCPSPIENLKVEYPVKREPPDLDSGQGIEHLSIHNGFGSGIGENDDSDADSVISDGKLQRLLDVKCEIQDYSSDSDDCVLDLKSERERSNSVQIIGDNYDSKCNLTDVAIQSTNEFAKREQRLNKNGDRGENSNNNSSVNNKRDDLIIGDSHSNNSNNHNNHNNKNSNGDISKAPSNAGNSSQVIELDDDDDEDDLIVVTKSTKTIKNSSQKAKSPVIVLLDSDDENDCVIVNDEQKIPKCDDKVKHKKIRSFSDNQVNEISSTTGSNISSKFSPFTERPACANGNNTSNNYRRMNRSGSSEVYALEDLTPEVSANHENTPNVIEDVAKIKEEDVKDPKDDASTSRSGQTPPPSEEAGIKDVAALTESTTVSKDQTLTDTTNKERKFRASNEIRYRRPIYDDVMQSRSYDSNLSILNKDRRSPTNYTNGYRFATSSIGRNLDQIRTRPFVSDTKVIMHRNNVTSLRRDIREDVSLGSGEDSPELRLDELSRRDFDQIWSGAVSSKIAQSGSFEAENLKEKTYDKHKEIADEILFGLNSPKSNQTESAAQVLDLRGQSLDKTPKMPSETTLLNYFSNTTATDTTNVEPPLHVKQRQRYFEGKLEQNLSKDLEENVLEKVQDLSLPPVEDSEAIINQPRGEMVPTLEGSDCLEDSQSLDQSDAKTNELHNLTSEESSDHYNIISKVSTEVLDMSTKDAEAPLCEDQSQRYFERISEASKEQNLRKDSKPIGENLPEKLEHQNSPPTSIAANLGQGKEAVVDALEQTESVEDDQSLDQTYTKTNDHHTSTLEARLDRSFAKYFSNKVPLREPADDDATDQYKTALKVSRKVLDMSTKDTESPLYDDRSQRYFEGISEASEEQNSRKDSESTGEDLPEKLEDLNSPPTRIAADLGRQKEAVVDALEHTESVEDDQSLDQTYTQNNDHHTSILEARLDRSFAKYFYNKAPLREPPDDDATDQYKTALKVSKKVLDVSTKDAESPLYDDRSQRYFEGISEASQEQNSPKDPESTGEDLPEKLEDLDSPPTHVAADLGRQKEAVVDALEHTESVEDDQSLDQTYTKANDHHTSTLEARLDRSFAKYFSNNAPLREPADDDATDQYKTALKVSKKVLDMSTKDAESPLYDDRSQRYFEGISEASEEQNSRKDSESTGEDLLEKLEDLDSPPTHVAADLCRQKEAVVDALEHTESVEDDQSLDQTYTQNNDHHTSTLEARLDRSFAKYFYNKAPLRKPPDDDATDQYKTALKVSKKVLDVSTKDTESPLYDDRSQRYFEGISEASQEQNLPKDSESTGEDLPEKLEDLNSPPTHVAADLGQQKEAVVDALEHTESVEDDQSLDQTYTKTNDHHTSTLEARLDRSFAKYFSNNAPLREPADDDSADQYKTALKVSKKVLDMSTKDAESPLYDDRSQRYFEGISEASQEQNSRKDSESTGEDLPEKLEDLNSPPTHVAADLGQQKEAVVDVLEQTESVEDVQSSDETYTKTNKRYTSKSEASLDRSFAKFLSDTIPRRRPADKDSTTKVLDKRSKYTEPPSFEEERQKYFEGMLNKPQEQSSGKDSERTTVIAKVNLKQTDHIEESDIKASPGRQPSRPLAKLDRSFSKYCINTSPSTTGALDMSTKKYVEPPSFEEQRQKYFETISEKDVSTEAILTESSTEEVADVEALNEDLEANLEQSQNNLVGHESKSDNEEELMMMQAPNQQESIDSAAMELEELLALSTADVKHEVSAENQVKIGKAQCVQTLSSELEQALELSQTDCCGSSTTTAAEPGLLEVHPCDNSDEAKPILEGASPTPSGDKTETIIQNENPIPNEEICNENYINSLAGDDIEEIYLVVPGEAVSGDKTEDDDVVFVLDSSMCDSGEFAGVEDDLIRINFLIEEDEVPESPPEVEQPPNTTDVEYRYNGSDIPTADEEVCVEHGETQLEYNDDVAYHEVIPENLYKDDSAENGDVVFLSNQDYISEAVHEVQTTQSSNDSASLQDTRNEAQPVIEDSEVVIEASELSIGEGDQIQAEAEITKGSCLEGGGEVLVEVQTQVDDAVSQKDAELITGEATQIDDEALRKDNEVITGEATQVDDEVASKEFAQPILPQSEPDVPEEGANYEDVSQVTTEVPTEHIEEIKNDTAEGVSEVTDDVDLVKQPESCQNREVRDDEVPIDLSKQNGEVGSENEVVPEDDHLISNAARIDRVENHNEVNSSKVETRDDLECIKLEEAAQIGSNIDLKNETLHTDTNTVMNVHEVNTVPHYVNANYVDVQMKYVKDEVTVTSHCEDLQNLVKAQITDFSDKCQILYPSVAIQHHTTPRPMSLSTLTSKFAESLAEKAEDIYYENLDILATAAAAQKSLKVEGSSKPKRSRLKMAAFNKSRAAKFKPNEVRETLRQQPANTIDATILAESDFNPASEDSCDSYGGKLIIAEEEHISNIDEAVFDEDTVDEKIAFVSTKLEDVEDTEIRICITDSEKYERAFNELELLEMDDVVEDDGSKRGKLRNFGSKLKIKDKKRKPRQNKNNLDLEVKPLSGGKSASVKVEGKKSRRKSPKKNAVGVKNEIQTGAVKKEEKIKGDLGLGFERFLMGESLMLTHDGEFVSSPGNKSKLISPDKVKVADEIKTSNDAGTIKQPIRTKAALKSYDKKNLGQQIGEDKFKLRPYVKLVTDPTIQKMIDNLPEKMPKITLARKNYRSLLDARKLLHRTSLIQNQKLKPAPPKIESPTKKDQNFQKTPQQAQIEEARKSPPIPEGKRLSLDQKIIPEQAKMASTEIKPVKLNSDKLEALPKYRKISKSVSLIEAKSKSFPNLSTTPDKTKLKSNKTSSGSNLAINGVKLDAKKQDDLNLKKTLSKLSQFGTTIEEIKIEADPRQQIRKTHSEREIKKVRNSENKNTNSSQKMKSARKILDRRKTEESFSRRKSNLESEDGLASKLKTRRLSMDVELVSFDKCKSNNFAKLVKMKRPEEVNRNKRKHENKIIKAECVLNKKSEGKRAKISADHDVIRIKPDKIDKIELEGADLKPSIPEEADVKPSISEETNVRKPSIPEEANAKPSKPEKADAKPSIPEETDVEKPSVPEEAGAKLSIPEKADVKPSIAEETDVEKPSVPEEAGAKPSIPEKADIKPSIAEETDVEKPSIPEEADAKSSIPEKADVKPSIAEQTDIEKLSIPEEADAKPGIPEKADTKPSIPEETDVEKPSILADVELSVPDEVIAEVSEIVNEILLKIEDLTHPSEIVAEFSPNKDEILEEVQAEATSEENVTKIKTEELQPKISHEIQEEIKPEPILIKTLKELATACLNAEPPDVILLENASDQEDENSPKLAESDDEAVPTPTTTGIEIKEDKSVDLEKVEQITNLPEHLESPLPLPQSPIVEEKLEESKEDVQELSPPHNIIKSYTRKPIIEKRHNDVKQSLQKEVPFHYVPKKKRVTFNAKEIILNATEFEKSNNTELNIASPKILNFDQSPPDLGGAIFHDEDKLKRKSLEEPPSIIPPIKKQKIEALPTIEIEKLKLSVRNKLERNQTEQKTKEQTLSSPTKRRDRKNIDEVINILRSNLEEKIEITIVQVIDEEKPNETAKIAEDNQKSRLFQPWQDPEPDQAKLQTEVVEVFHEDTQQEHISAIPENVQEIEPKTTEAIAVGQDTTSQEVVPPEKDVKTIEPEADVTIEPETTKPEVISPENDDEIPTIPTPEDKTTVEDRNVTENIFSTSTPLRLIQREYSFSSEEDAEPKNDEAELIVEDNLIETVPDDDPIDDKTMPNLSPIADQPNEEDSIKLTTDSQLTPPPILQKELPTPIGTNFATSALLDGADDAMTSVLEDIPTAQEKTFNFAAEDSLFDDNSKTSDMLLNFNENQFMNEKDQDLNITESFPEITDKPIDISYNLTPTPTTIDKPTDTTISDIIESAASQLTNMEPNEISWSSISTSESFLKNHDFLQQVIPEDNPVKAEALSMIYAKPVTPEKIDKEPLEIKTESIHKSDNHPRFTDNLPAIPSTSKICESSHLSAITTQMSSFGTDQVLTTRASDLHSAVNFGGELGVNSENANPMYGKDFDTIDEDDTPIIEKVKAYGTMHIGSGTNSDHNYSMGGPFLGGEYESSELSTKQLAQENDQKANSAEDFGNTGIEGDSMFPFSAQVCISFIENNLTQESNRSLNHSPVDGGTDYHLPEQDGQLPFSFAENQDATHQLQDSQNTIKILNQECDSRQEDNITSFREDFSNPMSVENMSSIQFNDFPLTNLGFEDIDRISFTAATVQTSDHQNHILKANEREKVTVIYNEHDFASTNSIKEITCLETPQLSKNDLIRSSIKQEVISTRQRRQSPEKVGSRSPKKSKKCKERDAPLSNFSSVMKAKAIADIERKKFENKRQRVDYGYIRQNTKTQVLAPVKKISPAPTPDRKSPQQTASISSSPARNEVNNVDTAVVPTEKMDPEKKSEEMLPILAEKPKDHKEIVQEKLHDLLSVISINNKFDTVKLRRRQPPERLSDTLAMEMLVKDSKNQLKQFSRPPTSPKQYLRSQNKPKKPIKLDKPGGKLVDYDDSSLSDEQPGKFYEKIKKDKIDHPAKRYSDTSDDDCFNKPKRTPTKTDLNRPCTLNNGEHAAKRPGDNSDGDFTNRSKIPRMQTDTDRVFDALKRSQDTNKFMRKKEETKNANQDFNLTPRWATTPNNFYDAKRRIPSGSQPRHDQRLYPNKSRSTIILNSEYNPQSTPYKHYQATTSQNPPNPRNLCSNARLPSSGKHANVPYGADGKAAKGGSHDSRSSQCTSAENPVQNPKNSSDLDWLNKLNEILGPPSGIFGTAYKH